MFRVFFLVFCINFILIERVHGSEVSEIIFPEQSHVINITQPPYNAVPDDDKDDTEAFQKVLADGVQLIYVPQGTYLISDTLKWGIKEKRQILQGQDEHKTIIRLKDSAQGFTDPLKPKPMIWTGKAPAQRFRNGLRNLTIDTGKANPGAIGVQFIANNQGGIRNVTIQSGDPNRVGMIGLDLGYTDEQGPCLIRNVTIKGFRTGIFTKHAVDSVTFEYVTLENQIEAGMINEGQCISLRGLISRNAVPAYLNKAGSSLTAIIDSELIYNGQSTGDAAIRNEAALFARNVKTSGYKTAIRNMAGTRENASGPVVQEFVSHPILATFATPARSLNLPIMDTPEVPWDLPGKWVSVTDFGPPRTVRLIRQSDGKQYDREDWSECLQKAIDSGATTVYFPYRDAEYGLYGTIRIRGKLQRLIGCEATLGRLVNHNDEKTVFQPEYRPVFIIEDGDAPVVRIERFDSWYAAIRVEQKSKRTLVLSSFSIYEIESDPGSGDIFLEDMRCKQITVRQSRLWGRQVNPEGWEEPRILNEGGQVWILGLKTENPSTIMTTRSRGKSEIIGGFFYSNKGSENPIRMFVNDDSSFSFTGGGSKTKKGRAFDVIVEEHRNGEKRLLERQQSYPRGEANMVPLYVGYTLESQNPVSVPSMPENLTADFTGRELQIRWTHSDDHIIGWTLDVLKNDQLIRRSVWGADVRKVFLGGNFIPREKYVIRLKAFNEAGESDPLIRELEIPDILGSIPSGTGSGLQGYYFSDPFLRTQTSERIDKTIDFQWVAEKPAPGVPLKGYSIRWVGQIEPPTDGQYTFVCEIKGGVRLWINDRMIIDAWNHADKREYGTIELAAKEKYPLRLEYRNESGGGSVQLSWMSSNLEREVIPQNAFYPDFPQLPVITMDTSEDRLLEGGSAKQYTVSRTGDLQEELVLNLSISGTAVEGTDYELNPKHLVFHSGQSKLSFNVSPLQDTTIEPTEFARIDLIPAAEYYVNGTTLMILMSDDDTPPPGDGIGLRGKYYDQVDFSSEVASRTDSQINFSWDKKKPHPNTSDAAGYSVRWEGFIQPLFSEEYTFELATGRNSAVKLEIDDKILVNVSLPSGRKRSPGEKLDYTGKITLEAGKKYPIVIEYVQPRDYGSWVRLSWKSKSQFEEIVPQSQLYPPD